jgi:hypothetical protein
MLLVMARLVQVDGNRHNHNPTEEGYAATPLRMRPILQSAAFYWWIASPEGAYHALDA